MWAYCGMDRRSACAFACTSASACEIDTPQAHWTLSPQRKLTGVGRRGWKLRNEEKTLKLQITATQWPCVSPFESNCKWRMHYEVRFYLSALRELLLSTQEMAWYYRCPVYGIKVLESNFHSLSILRSIFSHLIDLLMELNVLYVPISENRGFKALLNRFRRVFLHWQLRRPVSNEKNQ